MTSSTKARPARLPLASREQRHRSAAFALLVLLCIAVAGSSASAQHAETFTGALVRLASALGGTFGDEGPEARAALDAMSRALAAWDAELHALEARAEADASTQPPAPAAQVHVDLARHYFARTRTTDALQQLDQAARRDPGRIDLHLLRGLMHAVAGRTADASAAFQAAWEIDRANPVSAYWAIRHGAGDERPADGRRPLDALAASVRTPPARERPVPFPALSHASYVDEDGPLVLPARYAAAYRRLVQGDHHGALAGFREAAAADPLLAAPGVHSSRLREGSSALRQGRAAAAREHFQAALALAPRSSEAHRLLGMAHWLGGEFDASLDALSRAVALQPDDERSRIMIANVLVQAGRLGEAETLLRETAELLPASAYSRLWLGSVYQTLNRNVDAARAFEGAAPLAITGRRQLYAATGPLYEATASFEEGVDALSRGLFVNPNDPLTHLELARGYAGLDRRDEAFAEYAAVLLIDPVHPDGLIGVGRLHLDAGRYEEAAAVLERLVALQPGYAEARYALANALLRSGREDEGRKELAEFQRAQAQRNEQRRRTMALEVIKEEAALRTSEGNFDRAAALWQQATEIEPGVATTHAALAAVLAAAGRLDQAAQQYERAAALGGQPDVYRQLAATYDRLGRPDRSADARARYEQALIVPVRSSAGSAR